MNKLGTAVHSALRKRVHIGTTAALFAAVTPALVCAATDALFPSFIDLPTLDGSDGFIVNGVTDYDGAGSRVSGACDLNGDGIDDLIVGAPYADAGAFNGKTYVVFGHAGLGSGGSVELSSLNGTNGFVINGSAPSGQAGRAVSGAGDVNGDGICDLIIGAPFADTHSHLETGASYVVFGSTSVGAGGMLELSALDGTNGFVLHGVAQFDHAGVPVASAGDVNGDGIADLLIGAPEAKGPENHFLSGETYVVFGATGLGSDGTLDLASLNGTNGCALDGVDIINYAGRSVSAAGDFNGDGIDDMIVGAPGTYFNRGVAYVVLGSSGVCGGAHVNLSPTHPDGADDIVIQGIGSFDEAGYSVSGAGDVNGDGVDDVIIGAFTALGYAGQSYVVFGSTTFSAGTFLPLSSLNGDNGFAMDGIGYGELGSASSAAGDLNSDGIPDILIGARTATPHNAYQAGQSYVVFGRDDVGAGGSVDLSSLNGDNGLSLNGGDAYESAGRSLSGVGDVNGDGIDDVVIGTAARRDSQGHPIPGHAYVVMGRGGIDSDDDGVIDSLDNCKRAPNTDQRDSDGDGFGNVCDADLNNDCFTNFLDLGLLKGVFFSHDPNADLNGDGNVNFIDLGYLKHLFFQAPGPSGIPNACDGV